MNTSTLIVDSLNSSLYKMTLAWKPALSQLGANLVCLTPVRYPFNLE